jgi:hypothetical protein
VVQSAHRKDAVDVGNPLQAAYFTNRKVHIHNYELNHGLAQDLSIPLTNLCLSGLQEFMALHPGRDPRKML